MNMEGRPLRVLHSIPNMPSPNITRNLLHGRRPEKKNVRCALSDPASPDYDVPRVAIADRDDFERTCVIEY